METKIGICFRYDITIRTKLNTDEYDVCEVTSLITIGGNVLQLQVT